MSDDKEWCEDIEIDDLIRNEKINHIEVSYSKRLKIIRKRWPMITYKNDFEWFEHRSNKQYKMILYYMKNPKAAEFLLKWEYEHNDRFPVKMARFLIQNPIKFLKEHEDFLN